LQLTVNGDRRDLPEGLTAAALITELGLRREAVVVERNEQVIPRSGLDDIELVDGDVIEIIQMIAGG
jgi:thiamine biosynthesis protein ThiS